MKLPELGKRVFRLIATFVAVLGDKFTVQFVITVP
jgi:hypothetical protein